MKNKYLLAGLILFLGTTSLFSQGSNIGRLPIHNFSNKIYKGGTQTWDIDQDKNGVMYFANNDGLLSYDGTYWQVFPIANNTVVRSVYIAKDGKIYVGGQGELGYFFPNDRGSLVYNSLNHLIPEEYKNYADVWNIHAHKDEVIFQTGKNIFRYKSNQTITALRSGGSIEFSGVFKDQFYIKDNHKGLLQLKGNAFVILPLEKISSPITSFLPLDSDRTLVTTLKDGIFIFDGQSFTPFNLPNNDFIKEKRIYNASLLADGNIALGTSLAGLLIIDKEGKALRHVQKESGLQNANVLCVFHDQSNNIWLGLNNGIDYLEYESPFTYIYPDGKLEGTGYTVEIHNDKIYFGTSNGLYFTDWKSDYDPFNEQRFKFVSDTDGQVWGLSKLDEQLILNSHEGAFSISNGASKLITEYSTWKHVLLNDKLALCGGYNGLSIFKKENNQWTLANQLKGFTESSRILIKEKDGTVWVSHPYRGIYKVNLNPDLKTVDVKFYTTANGLPSDLSNYVFSINDKALFATQKGVYQYKDEEDSFVPYPILNDYLGEQEWIKLLKEDAYNNIWFVTNKGVGYLDVQQDGLQNNIEKKSIPGIAENLVGGFEFIYPFDAKNIFFAAEKGFIHYDAQKGEAAMRAPKVLMNKVNLLTEKDSLIFGGYFLEADTIASQQSDQKTTFDAHHNALRFFFSSTSYAAKSGIEYQTSLIGMDEDWSFWSNRSEKEYTNLSPGDYTFQVRARNAYGAISEPAKFSFEIKAPWYATTLAFILYALIALGLLGGMMYLQRNRYETEKKELKFVHEEKEKQQQQIVEETEQELNTLRNEQLEKEIQFQKKELASATMHIMQKGEMINSIREDLSKAIQRNADPAQVKKDIEKIIRMLQQDSILDDSWEQFTLHFDQVHSDFLKKIREKYPQLTNYDQKICAYLRMNLSTKEIATLMNISVRGVEGSRYRLRKKLNINKEVNLVKFIQKV